EISPVRVFPAIDLRTLRRPDYSCWTGVMAPMRPACRRVRKRPAARFRRELARAIYERRSEKFSIKARRGAAIDRDPGALDLPGAVRAQKQSERRNVLGRGHALDAALGQGFGAQRIHGLALSSRALHQELLGALGRGGTRMDGVDIDPVAHAQLRHALGGVGNRATYGAPDQELWLHRARRTADDVDDMALRGL